MGSQQESIHQLAANPFSKVLVRELLVHHLVFSALSFADPRLQAEL